MELSNPISKLNIQVIAEGHQPCQRDLEGFQRGRARRGARNRQHNPDLVVVAMRSALHAAETLTELAQQQPSVPVVTVVGDDPSWDGIGGTVHVHRDEEIIPAINRMITMGGLPN